jgi:hypothetical protein
VLLTLGFVIAARGAGSYSIDGWADIDSWAGTDWSISVVARAPRKLRASVDTIKAHVVHLYTKFNAHGRATRLFGGPRTRVVSRVIFALCGRSEAGARVSGTDTRVGVAKGAERAGRRDRRHEPGDRVSHRAEKSNRGVQKKVRYA